MVKVGRNDPCPCGSGRKYKKCCLERDEYREKMQIENPGPMNHITYEEINDLTTEEIIARLEKMNISFDETTFLEDVASYYSAEDISENWFKLYPVNALGRDEDYPWFAARILWERLAPKRHLSLEQLYDLYNEGVEYLDEKDPVSACDKWLEFWEGIKVRNNPSYQNLNYLDEQYEGAFYVSEICQFLELELHNAGIKNPIYFKKRIEFCREFCELYPEEDRLILSNMRIAIAASYWRLKEGEQAEIEFEKMIEDFPGDPWGYITWGDMCASHEPVNYQKAKQLYEKAKEIAMGSDDIEVVNERLETLAKEL